MKLNCSSAAFCSLLVLPVSCNSQYTAQLGLKNGGQGTYFVEIGLGTPSQQIVALVDTGSSDFWVYNSTAPYNAAMQTCIFNASASSTYRYLDPDFNAAYVSGEAASGDMVTDILTMTPGVSITNYTFGLANVSSSPWAFMGLSFPFIEMTDSPAQAFSPFTYPNIPIAMKNEGLINRAAFSVYLNEQNESCGSLLFGAIDYAKIMDGKLFTVPLLLNNDFGVTGNAAPIEYSVQINSITGQDIKNPRNDATFLDSGVFAVFDTGTPGLFAPETMYYNMMYFLGGYYSEFWGGYVADCSRGVGKTITIEFSGGNKYYLDSTQVLVPTYDGSESCYIFVFPSGSQSLVFGAAFMRSAYVVFDQDAYELSIGQAIHSQQSVIDISTMQKLTSSVIPTATLTGYKSLGTTKPASLHFTTNTDTSYPPGLPSSLYNSPVTSTSGSSCQRNRA